MNRNILVALAVVFVIGYLAIANGSIITNTSTATSPSFSSGYSSSSSFSSTGSTFTIADELNSQGADTWEQEYYFPSLGTGLIIDEHIGGGACPCQVSSVTQQGQNVQITDSNGGIIITSTPSAGYEKTVIGPGFQPWAGMPGLQSGDIFEHWQSVGLFRFTGLVTPFATPSASGYSSYGPAKLTRNGISYDGYGVYIHITSQSSSDPRPGFYWQFGWTPFAGNVLFVAKTATQDLSSVSYADGTGFRVSVSITDNSCSSFTYGFNGISLSYSVSRYLVGTSCNGETFGGFTDSQGDSGMMWAVMGR